MLVCWRLFMGVKIESSIRPRPSRSDCADTSGHRWEGRRESDKRILWSWLTIICCLLSPLEYSIDSLHLLIVTFIHLVVFDLSHNVELAVDSLENIQQRQWTGRLRVQSKMRERGKAYTRSGDRHREGVFIRMSKQLQKMIIHRMTSDAEWRWRCYYHWTDIFWSPWLESLVRSVLFHSARSYLSACKPSLSISYPAQGKERERGNKY